VNVLVLTAIRRQGGDSDCRSSKASTHTFY
jgi:hypothetical protein